MVLTLGLLTILIILFFPLKRHSPGLKVILEAGPRQPHQGALIMRTLSVSEARLARAITPNGKHTLAPLKRRNRGGRPPRRRARFQGPAPPRALIPRLGTSAPAPRAASRSDARGRARARSGKGRAQPPATAPPRLAPRPRSAAPRFASDSHTR